jgi:hypothetical protein
VSLGRSGSAGRRLGVGTVLKHPKTVLTVLARVEVVVLPLALAYSARETCIHLQSVHLPVSLLTSSSDGTNEWPVPLFSLFDR